MKRHILADVFCLVERVLYRTIEIVVPAAAIAACILALLALVAKGDEPFRLEPRAKAVESTKIEPIAMPAELLPAPAADGSTIKADLPRRDARKSALADLRPLVYVYIVHPKPPAPPICPPCEVFADWWLSNVDSSPFNIVPKEFTSFETLPEWVAERGVPLTHFEGEGGQWRASNWQGPEDLATRWKRYNPGRELIFPGAVTAAAPGGASIVDQLMKFAGPDGTIVITPSKPIKATIDDGTTLTYSRISGKYKIENGIPSIVFDPPLVRFDGRKSIFHFGGSLNDVKYEPPATLQLGTSIGKYRIKMEAAQ